MTVMDRITEIGGTYVVVITNFGAIDRNVKAGISSRITSWITPVRCACISIAAIQWNVLTCAVGTHICGTWVAIVGTRMTKVAAWLSGGIRWITRIDSAAIEVITGASGGLTTSVWITASDHIAWVVRLAQ